MSTILPLLITTAPLAAHGETLLEAADAAGVAMPLTRPWILVDKSEHTLWLYEGDTPLKRYTTGLGDPVGDKERQGDRKTPTGTFRIVTRNDRSSFHRFLGLSYPTAEDADRGLASGLVTESQAQAIRAADAAGRTPPWNTPLGGAIGIHGGGGGADWTLGCMAIANHEIDELWAATHRGTRVVIRE